MKRELSVPRQDWPTCIAAAGLTFHSEEVPYWREDVCYRFSSEEIGELEEATAELHQMCLEVVEYVITQDRYDLLHIPQVCRPAIRASWEQERPSLYGRFDLRYDGETPPVLLEYNADTPTSLIEASVAQWYWVESVFQGRDQFNSLHEKLVARWSVIQNKHTGPIHLTGIPDSLEDAQTVAYLQDTAQQAGLETISIPIGEIGWDRGAQCFVDQANHRITALFKLYPWEWLAAEPFGPLMLRSPLSVLEPAWKMILSNKGLLPLLWELFPGHPYLVPAFFTAEPLGQTYVKKPLLSREGANIEIVTPNLLTTMPGPYGREGWVYQAFIPLPEFEGWHPVIGSWVVGDEPAGIGIRETQGLITKDQCRFVPHYFDPAASRTLDDAGSVIH
ncbi:MAG TPA: glutathionylspermidine synthase family protein [Nitrospiraceae bacterium]|nr:glutathionylspermidine synthase family protein [Nitrospiraceae bacterium]